MRSPTSHTSRLAVSLRNCFQQRAVSFADLPGDTARPKHKLTTCIHEDRHTASAFLEAFADTTGNDLATQVVTLEDPVVLREGLPKGAGHLDKRRTDQRNAVVGIHCQTRRLRVFALRKQRHSELGQLDPSVPMRILLEPNSPGKKLRETDEKRIRRFVKLRKAKVHLALLRRSSPISDILEPTRQRSHMLQHAGGHGIANAKTTDRTVRATARHDGRPSFGTLPKLLRELSPNQVPSGSSI